mmetsp:Transcript_2533/g.5805  ORF Transcript_2533/g.5805 Transcript_2533/m.5805 type:complete len:279 (+) Transcript_2533:349-1185(+)
MPWLGRRGSSRWAMLLLLVMVLRLLIFLERLGHHLIVDLLGGTLPGVFRPGNLFIVSGRFLMHFATGFIAGRFHPGQLVVKLFLFDSLGDHFLRYRGAVSVPCAADALPLPFVLSLCHSLIPRELLLPVFLISLHIYLLERLQPVSELLVKLQHLPSLHSHFRIVPILPQCLLVQFALHPFRHLLILLRESPDSLLVQFTLYPFRNLLVFLRQHPARLPVEFALYSAGNLLILLGQGAHRLPVQLALNSLGNLLVRLQPPPFLGKHQHPFRLDEAEGG